MAKATVSHNKKDIIELVAKELGTTKTAAEKALNAVNKVHATISLEAGSRFQIEGIGTFTSEIKPAHTRVSNLDSKNGSIKKGDLIEVPARLKRKVIFPSVNA